MRKFLLSLFLVTLMLFMTIPGWVFACGVSQCPNTPIIGEIIIGPSVPVTAVQNTVTQENESVLLVIDLNLYNHNTTVTSRGSILSGGMVASGILGGCLLYFYF